MVERGSWLRVVWVVGVYDNGRYQKMSTRCSAMKVTKEQAQQNRQALLDAAGRLFKKHRIDGIGVAEVSREAGLTPGALYKHFADKQDLAAQAFSHAFRRGFDRVNAPPPGAQRPVDTYLKAYLSPRLRDDLEAGCPLIASACETGRQGEQLSQSFADAFVEFRASVESALPDTGDAAQRAALASVFVAAFVGAIAIWQTRCSIRCVVCWRRWRRHRAAPRPARLRPAPNPVEARSVLVLAAVGAQGGFADQVVGRQAPFLGVIAHMFGHDLVHLRRRKIVGRAQKIAIAQGGVPDAHDIAHEHQDVATILGALQALALPLVGF